MNECERLGTPFNENYEYYTNYSATPDSTISPNYSNVDQTNNIETSAPREANGINVTIEPKTNNDIDVCAKEADNKLIENPVANSNSALASTNCSQSPAKEKPAKKSNNKVIFKHFSNDFFTGNYFEKYFCFVEWRNSNHKKATKAKRC